MTATTKSQTAVDRLLDAVGYVGPRGATSYKVHCPAHDDGTESLSVTVGKDGRALVHCHAGCTPLAIVQAAGMTLADLFDERQNGAKPVQQRRIVATYDYVDEDGALLYQAVRYDPKDFRQRRPDGDGGWEWKLGDTRRVLYRLPELVAADPAAWVFVVEGEKDANNLAALGLVATCNAMGAGKWEDVYTEQLARRHVVIVPDNDQPGREHAEKVARSLTGSAATIRVLQLPGLRDKGDVSDWLAAGHDAGELIDLVNSAPEYGATTADDAAQDDFLLTAGRHDEGNAQAVHRRYDRTFAHNKVFGWLRYADGWWQTDGADAAVDRAIVETLQARVLAAMAANDMSLASYCLPSKARVEGAKALLRSLCDVQTRTLTTEHPDLLNCSNGVVNLRTGELRPHDRNLNFRYCIPTPYDRDADYSRWSTWLTETVGEDGATYLQFAAGYSLTGHTSEEVLFYLYGPSRSGKGTFTETMRAMMGAPLCQTVAFNSLLRNSNDPQNFALAPLTNARLVTASESNQFERFDEAKIKTLTGGDTIRASFKGRDHFDYRPAYKIWLASNQMVNADPDDDAVWGRVRVIEFPHSYLGTEDKSLKARMMQPDNLRGVLRWAVQGAIWWHELGSRGLPERQAQVEAKAKHRHESDFVGQWLDERVLRVETASTSAKNLFQDYAAWCKDNGVQPKSAKGLGLALKRKGFESKAEWAAGSAVKTYHGLALRPG